MRERSGGITLIELLVTVAVLAVLLGIVLPSWQSMFRANRLTESVNALVASLQLARHEAIRSGQRVTLCASKDGATCSSEGYEHGWIVFRDTNADTKRDPGETLLHVRERVKGVTLRGNGPVARMISYTPLGTALRASGAFQAGTIHACAGERGRKVVLSRSGRIRTEHAPCG